MTSVEREIERRWMAARNRAGKFADRRTPSPGITATLTTLLLGSMYESELARRSGQDQGNLSGQWLPKLQRFGFVDITDVVAGIGGGNRHREAGGARPAVFWKLTKAGRELALLLTHEEVSDVA